MATQGHKRETARRKPRAALIAAPLAVLATGVAVTAGVVAAKPDHHVLAADSSMSSGLSADHNRELGVLSRGGVDHRGVIAADAVQPLSPADKMMTREAVAKAIKNADTSLWTTTTLNLWTRPDDRAKKVGEIKSGKKVLVTGRKLKDREEIVVDGESRWVTVGYLSSDKPLTSDGPLSTSPCPDGSIENGLAEDTVLVYRAVCHAFPQVTQYAGWAPRPEHDTGHAIDVMVYGDKALGDAIAAWAQAHASELNLYDIIWYDRIWTPVRASEGWRDYGDHGSATANHMDHVHLGTN